MTSTAQNHNQAPPPNNSALHISNAVSPPSKRDLKSWWKGFKLPSKHQETQESKPGIFGVPLRQSITYANVAISLIDERGQSYIYGYVPIVVAKCGVFLKERATGIEGIFRLSGSEKRIKELKNIFDSPDRYGKGLVWDGYTVHDAANVLRRYLNDLPEPVVPLDLYEKFREPLRGATKQAVGDAEGPQFVENFNEKAAIRKYQELITQLPPLNRQLLLYILDLLAVFAAKSDENRMNSQNLAAIFQPGMLSHPDHAMAPEEYRLNQCVIIFLIENQDHFLIGMQGTGTDEKTKKEIESGTSKVPVTPSPNRRTSLGRSASNASAGAESVRRHGQLRRNRSVSSRNSRHEGTSTPNSPALTATPTGGLGRSNTVPSKKSPALVGGRFQKHDPSSPRSPHHLEPLTQLRSKELEESEKLSLAPGVGSHSQSLSPTPASAGGRSQERLLDILQDSPTPSTPSKERNLPSIFQRGSNTPDKRQPNKLRKKNIPGSLNPSAQSSNASFHQLNAQSPSHEAPNPMDQTYPLDYERQSQQMIPPPPVQEEPRKEQQQERLQEQSQGQQLQQLPPPASAGPQASDVSSDITPRASQVSSNHSLHPDNTLKAKMSPPTSLHSSFNEGSDIDQVIDDQSMSTSEQAEREKKRRWRLSRSRGADNGLSPSPGLTSSRMVIGSNENADVSTLSISSSSHHRPRKSESSDPTAINDPHGSFDYGKENRDESKGPIGWIKNKYREAKGNAEQRRNRSPPADRQSLSSGGFGSRGKSLDIKRESPTKEAERPAVPMVQPVPGATPIPAPIPAPVPVTAPVPVSAQQQQPSPPSPQKAQFSPPQQQVQPQQQQQQSPPVIEKQQPPPPQEPQQQPRQSTPPPQSLSQQSLEQPPKQPLQTKPPPQQQEQPPQAELQPQTQVEPPNKSESRSEI
ncbi:Fc.00g077440.m01.CDS01 [Cosmosporella sp. VM-42]